MNPITSIIRNFRHRKMADLDAKVAGLTARLNRTEKLAARCKTPMFDVAAINITAELWENKRRLQILAEHDKP